MSYDVPKTDEQTEETKVTKFEAGEKVVYHRGKAAEGVGLSPTVEAMVKQVSTDYHDLEYTEPLYHIRWLPTGYAVVGESQLSHP